MHAIKFQASRRLARAEVVLLLLVVVRKKTDSSFKLKLCGFIARSKRLNTERLERKAK